MAWNQESTKLRNLLECTSISDLAIATCVGGISPEQIYSASKPLHLQSLEIYGSIRELWTLNIEWSHLTRLVLHAGIQLNLVDNEPSLELSGLKSLELEIGATEILDSVLQSCQRLETLSLTGDMSHVRGWETSRWQRLGRSLTKLRLCETSTDFYSPIDDTPEMLCDSTLRLIAQECPKLRSLGIDLDYDGFWVSLYTKYRSMIELR